MLITAKRKQLAAAGALVVALGLGVTGFAAAQDWGGVSDPEDRQPAYQSSVTVADTAAEEEVQQLQDVAKITADAAKLAAQRAIPGTPSDVKLENENGSVVYEVDVRATDGTETDVQVDAGNGTVLAQEREEAEPEDAADEAETNEADEAEKPEEVEVDD